MDLGISGLISGALGAGASIMGGINAGRVAKIQRKGQMDLAQYAYQKDLEMWNRNNEYNSPAEQMKRLQAAGLNPNMVYGSGSVVGNTSGSIPQFKSPSQYPVANVLEKIGPALNMISAFQDFQLKREQINNIQAQNELIKNKSITEALNPDLVKSRTGLTNAQTDYTIQNQMKVGAEESLLQRQIDAENLYSAENASSHIGQFQFDMKKAQLRNLQLDQILKDTRKKELLSVEELNRKRMKNVDADTALKVLEKDYQKMGINKSDPVYFRVLSRLLNYIFPNLKF